MNYQPNDIPTICKELAFGNVELMDEQKNYYTDLNKQIIHLRELEIQKISELCIST